jgi:hypothetical protein
MDLIAGLVRMMTGLYREVRRSLPANGLVRKSTAPASIASTGRWTVRG